MRSRAEGTRLQHGLEPQVAPPGSPGLTGPVQDRCVGKYQLREHLGDGGMGTVYRATVAGSEASVAVKVIHPHLQRERGFRARFEREADLGRRVDHENVVRTLGAEIVREGDRETAVLVMEYVEGRTLRALLAELGTVPESLLRELARQIAAGLRSIHEAGIIHRDLKPENVLITRDAQVRIMDLGVARPVRTSSPLTKEGHFAGSLLYAAPEQLRGATPGTAYDQYALGLILYELATGRHPFPGESAAEIVGAHLHASPRRLIDTQPNVSPFFSEVVATLMDKAPERRFASTAELHAALERGEEGTWWVDRSRDAGRRGPRLRIPVTREADVVGRTRELGMLRGAWDAARRGEGRTVFVEGEAGVGKTRFLDAFVGEVEHEFVHALYGSYPPEGAQNGLTKAVVDHLGRADLAARIAPYLEGSDALARALAAALRHEVPVDGATPSLGAESLSAALVRLARGLAAERPVLWFVEDLHNASPAARHRVLALARAARDLPLLLVLTARTGALDQELPELTRLAGFRRMQLPRLGSDALQRLVDSLFVDAGAAERVGPLIAGRSDGVPFFVFELLHGLTESGRLRRRADGRYEELSTITEVEAPSAVRDLVRLRLHELSADQRHLVDVAAVQGHAFDPDLQARVLQAPRVRVLQTLAHLERKGGLVRSKGARYQFDHHLVQEVVRNELPLPLLQEYHALLAHALAEREGVDLESAKGVQGHVAHTLVVHLLGSTEPRAALPFLRAAANHLSLHAGEEAARALLRKALDIIPDLPAEQRFDLLLVLAGSLHADSRQQAECEAIDEAAALADALDDDCLRARAETARGVMLVHAGALEEAVQVLQGSIRLSEAGGFDDVTALSRQHLVLVLAQAGRHPEALEQCEAGRAATRRTGNRRRESALLGQAAAALWALQRETEAEAAAEEAVQIAREEGDWAVETRVLAQIGSICMRSGRHAEAVDAFLRFLEIVQARGHGSRISYACGNLGRIYEDMGRLADACGRYEQSIRVSRELGDRRTESMSRGLLGGVRRALGDFEGAVTSVEHSLRIGKDVGDRRLEACGLNVLGSVALDRDATGEALALLRAAIALFDHHPFPSGRAGALRWLGLALVRRGEVQEGCAALEEARALARSIHAAREELPAAAALAVLGVLDAGEVLAALGAEEARLDAQTRMRVLHDLHRATGDPALLAEAQALLEHLIRHAPAAWREPMRRRVPLHREIATASV